jgi:hypothetical protein
LSKQKSNYLHKFFVIPREKTITNSVFHVQMTKNGEKIVFCLISLKRERETQNRIELKNEKKLKKTTTTNLHDAAFLFVCL